jgi:hypothetical protein
MEVMKSGDVDWREGRMMMGAAWPQRRRRGHPFSVVGVGFFAGPVRTFRASISRLTYLTCPSIPGGSRFSQRQRRSAGI